MSRAAVSILVFGMYIALMGLTLIFAPNLLLTTLGIQPTHEPWLRMFGIIVVVLGLYYVQAARTELTAFFRFTTWGRPIAFAGFLALILLRMLPPIMVIFAIVDAAGAMWTAYALKN
jgi:hypothetical protein